jgi:minimal CRISPR polymerase domain
MGQLIKENEDLIFVAVDGDGIGRLVGRAVLNDDPDQLHSVSDRIDSAQALITRWIKDRNGTKISGGGDECTMAVPKEAIELLPMLRKDVEYAFGFTISVGVGKSLSEAGRALLIAKLKGKNRIEKFSKEMEKEIKAIKKRAKRGAFKSMEEHKLAEAYLNKSEAPEQECEYCAQSDGVDGNHCKWCHDAEVQDGEENCPYCKGVQNDPAEGAQLPEMGEEDCAYCNEKEQQNKNDCEYCQEENVANESSLLAPRIGTGPDSTNEQAPAGSPEDDELYARMDMAPPEFGKPLPPDERPPIGQNAPMDVVPKTPEQEDSRFVDGDHGSSVAPSIDPEDNHSKEALQLIAEEIERGGQPTTQEVNAIDDAQMPVGDSAEGNISRPEGYAQNTPQDMGVEGPNPPSGPNTDDDEPDFYGVLESGLDQHADGIRKEKTIRMISEALTQFKAAKSTLEDVKLKAPGLYAASISMLRAMIEMASLLELGNSAKPEAHAVLGSEQAKLLPKETEALPQEEQNDEWHDPFPTHPDQGGEAKPQHAPSKNNPAPHSVQDKPSQDGPGAAIGQPVGKLSSKHTTKHIPRTPTPPGAINANGQQKVIDPKTGKTRWIDRKQGMVQSPTGVPIKSPSRESKNASHN